MTDILDRIDADIQAWEARPESWLPGDPLHTHPYDRDDGDAHVVRPMFQLVDDWAPPPRCRPCQVTWSGDDGCWMCGEERPAVVGSRMSALLARIDHGNADVTWSWIRATPPAFADAIRAAAEMEQAMSRTATLIARAFGTTQRPALNALDALKALAESYAPPTPPGPPPLPVDGHAYRRRTRRRTRR